LQRKIIGSAAHIREGKKLPERVGRKADMNREEAARKIPNREKKTLSWPKEGRSHRR